MPHNPGKGSCRISLHSIAVGLESRESPAGLSGSGFIAERWEPDWSAGDGDSRVRIIRVDVADDFRCVVVNVRQRVELVGDLFEVAKCIERADLVFG